SNDVLKCASKAVSAKEACTVLMMANASNANSVVVKTKYFSIVVQPVLKLVIICPRSALNNVSLAASVFRILYVQTTALVVPVFAILTVRMKVDDSLIRT